MAAQMHRHPQNSPDFVVVPHFVVAVAVAVVPIVVAVAVVVVPIVVAVVVIVVAFVDYHPGSIKFTRRKTVNLKSVLQAKKN